MILLGSTNNARTFLCKLVFANIGYPSVHV